MAPNSDKTPSNHITTEKPPSHSQPQGANMINGSHAKPIQGTNHVHHKLSVSAACTQGGRKYMEDYYSIAYQQCSSQGDSTGLEFVYAGIFDGHGGREAAAYAKEHLMKNIVSQPGFWKEDDDSAVLDAIKTGFIKTHADMKTQLRKSPNILYVALT